MRNDISVKNSTVIHDVDPPVNKRWNNTYFYYVRTKYFFMFCVNTYSGKPNQMKKDIYSWSWFMCHTWNRRSSTLHYGIQYYMQCILLYTAKFVFTYKAQHVYYRKSMLVCYSKYSLKWFSDIIIQLSHRFNQYSKTWSFPGLYMLSRTACHYTVCPNAQQKKSLRLFLTLLIPI